MEETLLQARKMSPGAIGRRQEAFLHHAWGLCHLYRGRFRDAQPELEAAADLADEMGDRHIAAFDRVYQAEALLFQAQYWDAGSALDACVADAPSERLRKMALARLGLDKPTLIVASLDNQNLALSSRNLPDVTYVSPGGVNVYNLLTHEHLALTREAAAERAADEVGAGDRESVEERDEVVEVGERRLGRRRVAEAAAIVGDGVEARRLQRLDLGRPHAAIGDACVEQDDREHAGDYGAGMVTGTVVVLLSNVTSSKVRFGFTVAVSW